MKMLQTLTGVFALAGIAAAAGAVVPAPDRFESLEGGLPVPAGRGVFSPGESDRNAALRS